MLGSIERMRFYHHQPAARREAGFINSEALILGGILIVLAGLILGAGVHAGSHTLIVAGIVIGSLGLIFYSFGTIQILRYRSKLKKKPKLD
ncbi:MAG: hypothetical protein WCK57_01525 [Verrucomicrobiae bacterium]